MASATNSPGNLLYPQDPNILNPTLFNTSNIEVQFYQRKLAWPWRRGDVHALGWVYYAMGLTLIYGLLNYRDRRLDARRLRITIQNRRDRLAKRQTLPSRSTFDRMSTHARAFSYLRWHRMADFSFGVCALIGMGFMYPLLYIFTQHPYYAQLPELGPPPLAGRSGMIAIAILPFVMALGMKVNLVSIVTGMGHEKLNVLHRWLGFLMGILSVIHALPFLVEPVVNGGWGKAKEKFMSNTVYLNGVGALACLMWLCVASLPSVRKFCYEFFVHVHIFMGAMFIGLMFWHCNNMLTSWHYLYATVIILVGCLIYRILFRTNLHINVSGELAHFTPLTSDGVKITISTTMRWKAGQHMFIRIPSIAPFDNHPFTVASAAINPPGEHNDLVLVFKPHRGFTRRVSDITHKNPGNSFRAYLDGPYGGLQRKLEAFETVLLIAGGSGITPIIGHLHELAAKVRKKEAITKDIRVIWAVKHFDSFEWFKDEISKIARTMPRNCLLVQYFVTQETPVPLPAHPVSATRDWPTSPRSPMTPIFPGAEPLRTGVVPDEQVYGLSVLAMRKELGHHDNPHAISTPDEAVIPVSFPPKMPPPLGDEVMLEFGRPPLRDGLRTWSEGFGKRACIYVCGPPSMKVDAANAAAKMQEDIWLSDEREEVYLHTETFGW